MENGKADIELNLERLIQRPMIKVEDHSGLGDVFPPKKHKAGKVSRGGGELAARS